MSRRGPISKSPRHAERGFSFLELLTVMGAMATLMGLAVGYLSNVGKSSEMSQARRLLVETGHRCRTASMGNKRAFLTLSKAKGLEASLRLEAGIARTVFTHQFEELEFASGARTPIVEGSVTLVRGGGHTGSGAKFAGGSLQVSAESVFAMTEGLEFEAWIRPEASRSTMSLISGTTPTGDIVYAVELVREGDTAAYDLRFRVRLRGAHESVRVAGDYKVFSTKGAPIAAGGRAWVHVAVSYDGNQVRMKVGGHPTKLQSSGTMAPEEGGPQSGPLRIAIPASGTVLLALGTGYRGLMDTAILRGVFRSRDYQIDLPDRMIIVTPSLPIRVEYANGRLSGRGAGDVVIWIRDEAHPDDMPLRLTYGRSGTVEAKYVDQPIRTSTDPSSAGSSSSGADTPEAGDK